MHGADGYALLPSWICTSKCLGNPRKYALLTPQQVRTCNGHHTTQSPAKTKRRAPFLAASGAARKTRLPSSTSTLVMRLCPFWGRSLAQIRPLGSLQKEGFPGRRTDLQGPPQRGFTCNPLIKGGFHPARQKDRLKANNRLPSQTRLRRSTPWRLQLPRTSLYRPDEPDPDGVTSPGPGTGIKPKRRLDEPTALVARMQNQSPHANQGVRVRWPRRRAVQAGRYWQLRDIFRALRYSTTSRTTSLACTGSATEGPTPPLGGKQTRPPARSVGHLPVNSTTRRRSHTHSPASLFHASIHRAVHPSSPGALSKPISRLVARSIPAVRAGIWPSPSFSKRAGRVLRSTPGFRSGHQAWSTPLMSAASTASTVPSSVVNSPYSPGRCEALTHLQTA